MPIPVDGVRNRADIVTYDISPRLALPKEDEKVQSMRLILHMSRPSLRIQHYSHKAGGFLAWDAAARNLHDRPSCFDPNPLPSRVFKVDCFACHAEICLVVVSVFVH